MANEQWRYASSAKALGGRFFPLPSDEQRVLRELMETLDNKPFLRHQSQEFDQFPLMNAYG